jgi:hypothetical protein
VLRPRAFVETALLVLGFKWKQIFSLTHGSPWY